MTLPVENSGRAKATRVGNLSYAAIEEALVLQPAMVAGLLMTLPDQPNSRLQRYGLTALGQRWLRTHNGEAKP